MKKVPIGKLHVESTSYVVMNEELHVESLVPTRRLMEDLSLAMDEWCVATVKRFAEMDESFSCILKLLRR